MDQGLSLETLQTHCRTCLSCIKGNKHPILELSPSMLKLFQESYEEEEYETFHEELYPKALCFRCYWRFKSYDEFKELCQKSQNALKEFFKITTTVFYEIEEHREQKSNEQFQQTEMKIYEANPYDATPCDEDVLDTFEFEEIDIKEEERISPVDLNEYKIEKEDYNCNICLQTFSCGSSRSLHMRTHLKKRPFQCNQCHRGFNIKIRLKRHIDEVHSKNSSEIECKFGCGKLFQRNETAQAHYRKNHSSNTINNIAHCENLKNSESNEIDNISNDYKNHIETDNFPKSISTTTCKVCFQNCSSKSSLRIHMRTHLAKRPYQCDKCERSFNVRTILNNHIKEVHTETPLQIECKFGCGKIFHRSGTAETHYRLKHILPSKGITPNDRSRICEDCGKVCRNISFLKEHRYQHIPIEESPYYCEKCGRHFRSKKVMNRHLERHEPIRKYECSYCGIKKATRQDLVIHINGHTKEKKYPCAICTKIFYNAENLRRHKLAVHLGIKKYKCRNCEQSFGKAEERAQHELEQHTKKQDT